MTLAAVTGRFQPVHAQHLELFALALAEHDHLVVAVTNPDSGARHEAATSTHRHTDAANPFTAKVRRHEHPSRFGNIRQPLLKKLQGGWPAVNVRSGVAP